ncbi:cytochrome P450 [Aspergillus bertholletiae]|uniref:Cytochrome P450 n=1 Tax=Aspergillus bertholletiae TaxID=1226010 RepID=A0A5N7BGM7_9EURO|nr:cytochrome P450 [Aspergillus bertholletiae]
MEDFEFVYATAPFHAAPGSGILPTFEGLGPYFTWLEDSPPDDTSSDSDVSHSALSDTNRGCSLTVHGRLVAVHEPIRRAVTEWQTQNPNIPIVGSISFSKGALVTALLLWQQQMGQISWFPVMRVGLFICCWYQDQVTQYMREEVSRICGGVEVDNEKLVIWGTSSLHLQGRDDFTPQGSKMLMARHFVPGEAQVSEFAGRHHFPNQPCVDVVTRTATLIMVGDKEWLDIAKYHSVTLSMQARQLRLWPIILRPILLEPIIQERRAEQTKSLAQGIEPPRYVDSIQWLEDPAKGQWYDATGAQLAMAFAGVYSTSDLLIGGLVDIVRHPHLIKPLRDKIRAVIGEEGWTLASLYKPKLLDSCLKESQRIKPVECATMRSVALQDVPFSNGTFVPKGELVAVAGDRMRNPDVWPEPKYGVKS